MSIAEQLTQTMEPLLDAVYAAGKAAGTGGSGNRREYSGKIVSEVVGSDVSKDYVTLVEANTFLEGIYDSATLFVRVEWYPEVPDTREKLTIVKNWAVNVPQEVMPSSQCQLIKRYDANAVTSLGYNAIPLCSEKFPDTGRVGILKITKYGELRLYSGSTGYAIRPGTYKVIVEW